MYGSNSSMRTKSAVKAKSKSKPQPDSLSSLKFKVSKKNQGLGASELESTVKSMRSGQLQTSQTAGAKSRVRVESVGQFIQLLKSSSGRLGVDADGYAYHQAGKPQESTSAAIEAVLEDCFLKAKGEVEKYPMCGLFHRHVALIISGQPETHRLLASILKDYQRHYDGYVTALLEKG